MWSYRYMSKNEQLSVHMHGVEANANSTEDDVDYEDGDRTWLSITYDLTIDEASFLHHVGHPPHDEAELEYFANRYIAFAIEAMRTRISWDRVMADYSEVTAIDNIDAPSGMKVGMTKDERRDALMACFEWSRQQTPVNIFDDPSKLPGLNDSLYRDDDDEDWS